MAGRLISPNPGPPPPDEYRITEEDTMITGRGADPTHHIKLIDGEGSSVGFVITDQEGMLDERTFRRFPSSDPQNPYVTEKQESFGGGFGQRVFEENRSKYWRSKAVDTTKDALTLAPMFHYGRGAHSMAREYMPDSAHTMRWIKVKGATAWMAMPFIPDQEWSEATYLKLWLQKIDTPSTLRIRTYTSDGEPNTLINTTDVEPTSITHTDGEWVRIAVPDTYTFGAATTFWVVLTTTGPGNGSWRVLGTYSGTGGKKSTDGSTWANGPEFYFRLEGDRSPANHKFFTYKKQEYFIARYDAWGPSRLFLNGWRGAADSNSGAKNHLKDSTTDWSTTDYITGNEVAQMYAGPASGEQEDRRNVSSGADGYLVVSPNWQITHSTRDEYVVTNSDWWFEITGAGSTLNGRVSDVGTGSSMVYFARGNNRYVTAFEEYRNSAGDWTKRYVPVYTKAQFIQAVNDPVLGDILWLGHNRVVDGAYKPYVWYSVPIDGHTHKAFDFVHMSPNSGGGAAWIAAGGAQTVVAEEASGAVKITVTIGEATGVSINAQGTGYAVNDSIYINESEDYELEMNVDSVGGSGEILSISIVDAGYDYDVATGQAVTTDGGGDGEATVDIDTVSTLTGDVAYLNLRDSDGASVSVDLRNMTSVYTNLSFNQVEDGANQLAAGDLKLKLSTQLALGNVISTVSMVGLSAGFPYTLKKKFASLSLAAVAGADGVRSIGLSLDAGHTLDRSFFFRISGEWIATRDRTPVEVGFEDGDNITGLQAYGDPETAWVFTEAGFGMIKNNKFLPVPMREVKNARHANNGKGNEVSDVYLLLTWKGRLQRYYRQNMEDLGPDFPEGMADIAGDIVDVVTYPGRFFVAIDGGESASSSILVHKGGGWHEMYTSFSGERIRKLHIQPIEGKPDKLWASVGGDVMWFPIILDSTELPANSGYDYVPMGYLDTSWIYSGDRDLNKVYRSLWATMDKAIDDDKFVRLYYKVDNEDGAWQKVSDRITHSYSTTEFSLLLGNSPEPRGNRIKFRLHLRTRVNSSAPVVRSIQSRMYRLPEVKYIYTWLSKVSSISVNLRGDEERVLGTLPTAEIGMGKLDYWASNLTVLTTESDIAQVNNRQVIIEPVPFQLLMMVHDEGFQEESVQMSANEV
jgi:hypothetical protein